MQQYAEWITHHVSAACAGQCAEVTLAMCAEFPELTRVRGHYYDVVWGERQHWWLVATDGAVIDPTASQFPTKGRGVYIAWEEGQEEPTGKCLECGSLCYGGASVCSAVCEQSLHLQFSI